eukprot:GHVQ01015494.1.p1 GENE.GHVQ01015494.1~~GHVQ01015494.1.p1  ORF type:complete len:693 (-),score=55.39 GHVQ01015494.1:101-2179(-)
MKNSSRVVSPCRFCPASIVRMDKLSLLILSGLAFAVKLASSDSAGAHSASGDASHKAGLIEHSAMCSANVSAHTNAQTEQPGLADLLPSLPATAVPSENDHAFAAECPRYTGYDWDLFAERLFLIRAMRFGGATESSMTRGYHDLLSEVTSNLTVAFECPLAVAAAFYSAAEYTVSLGYVRLPRALIQLGFSYVQRNRGFRQDTIFPVAGWDMMLAGYHLQHRTHIVDQLQRESYYKKYYVQFYNRLISGHQLQLLNLTSPHGPSKETQEQMSWNDGVGHRHEAAGLPRHLLREDQLSVSYPIVPSSFRFNLTPEHRNVTSPVAIVSVCGYSETEPLRQLSEANHMAYASYHNYNLYSFTGPPNVSKGSDAPMVQRAGFWYKLLALQQVLLMTESRHKWLLWVDCDAFFMEPSITIDSIILQYSNYLPDFEMSCDIDGGCDQHEVGTEESNQFPPYPVATESEGLAPYSRLAQQPSFSLTTQDAEHETTSLTSRTEPELGLPPPPPSSYPHLIVAEDSTGLNNGVFIVRNSDWTLHLLHKWWESYEYFDHNHNCSDQASMQHLLLHNNTLRTLGGVGSPDIQDFIHRNGAAQDSHRPQIKAGVQSADINDDKSESLWDPAIWPFGLVAVASQQHLNSFHDATAKMVLSREWRPGDFIKHHPGCHYYYAECQHLYLEAQQYFASRLNSLLPSS